MPNWIYNKLYITGSATEREVFRLAARGVYSPSDKSKKPKKVDLQFSSFCPPPPIERLKKIYAHELDPDWPVEMKWQSDNWGCKWDLWDNVKLIRATKSSLVYGFLTAWSPPIEFVRRVSCLYYNLRFSLHTKYSGGTRFVARFAAGENS